MKLEDLVEMISLDVVVEGIGIAAAVGFLIGIFFGGGYNELFHVLVSAIG